jgi:hypothetical protein
MTLSSRSRHLSTAADSACKTPVLDNGTYSSHIAGIWKVLVWAILAGFIGIGTNLEAATIEVGHWENRINKHWTKEAWEHDWNKCQAKAEALLPAKDWATLAHVITAQRNYVMYKCMPIYGWRWITERVVHTPGNSF